MSNNTSDESSNQKKWDSVREKANTITDSNGHPIDEGIKLPVTAMMVHGFDTTASCEGHIEEDHGYPYPWVEVIAPEPVGFDSAEGEKRESLEKAWLKANLRQRKRMMDLLDAFYQDRDVSFDARLHFSNIGIYGGFRIQSTGAEVMALLSIQEQSKKLDIYRKEMKSFALYLKNRLDIS